MKLDWLLVPIVFTGSALCWWPSLVEPHLDLPALLPLGLVAFMPGAATVLSRSHWLRFAIAATAGTFAGLSSGAAIFPPSDPIAGQYTLFVIALGTIVFGVLALIVVLASRRLAASNRHLCHLLWVFLLCCLAFGPVTLALKPRLVARRIVRNDALAAERFTSLKAAVEQTAEEEGLEKICDGRALQQHYSGPSFSEEDWRRITENYVKEDGYVFMVYCHEKSGYTIHAFNGGTTGYGTRGFCTDETRKVSCGMGWNLSRYACAPCPR